MKKQKLLITVIENLKNLLTEAHQLEVEENHFGDKHRCSYCAAIHEAEEILKAAKK